MNTKELMNIEIGRAQRDYLNAMRVGNVPGMDRARERFDRLTAAQRSRARTQSTLRMLLVTPALESR